MTVFFPFTAAIDPEEMKPPLIHIGYHKTATSWLQREIFRCPDSVFESLDIRSRNAARLATHFYTSHHPRQLLSPFADTEVAIRARLKQLEECLPGLQEKVPVISNERLSGNPHAGSYDARIIADRIQKSFPASKILIVVREQRAFIRSLYFQYLSRGGTDSLAAYLRKSEDGKRPGFGFHQPEFTGLIKYYFKLFGRENVCVLPYEYLVKNPKLFLKKLGDHAGVTIPFDETKIKRRHNTKPHPFMSYKLRWAGRFLESSSLNGYSRLATPTTRKLVTRCFEMGGKLFFDRYNQSLLEKLEHDVGEMVGERYAVTNMELECLIGIDLKQLGYAMIR